MRQCFLSLLPMQLGILQISLNSSAIRSHISEIGTVIYIYIYIYWLQCLPNGFSGLTYNALYYIISNSKKVSQRRICPFARYLKQTLFSDSQKCKDKWHKLSNYVRERRKSKEKISVSGATARGKWLFYGVMNFLEYYLQRRTMEIFQWLNETEVSFTDPRWNWNGQFWTTGRRKYNSWSENGRRVE